MDFIWCLSLTRFGMRGRGRKGEREERGGGTMVLVVVEKEERGGEGW